MTNEELIKYDIFNKLKTLNYEELEKLLIKQFKINCDLKKQLEKMEDESND